MGNANSGRNVLYNDTFMENEGKELLAWINQNENVFLIKFATMRGYHPQRLSEWAEANKIFSENLALAKAIQEVKLLERGLLGQHKEQMSKFVLTNHHGYREKFESDHNVNGKITFSVVDYSQAIDVTPHTSVNSVTDKQSHRQLIDK